MFDKGQKQSSTLSCDSSYLYFFLIMNEYDQNFNPNILIGHNGLISWFSDSALYLNTQWVYDHISFTLLDL